MATYIVNTNEKEVHRTAKTEGRCKINEMSPSHRIDTDNAEQYFNKGYNGCFWCYRERHTS